MARRTPTEQQLYILEIIRKFAHEHGYPPSVREIGKLAKLSSSSTVHLHLRALERHGLLYRDPSKPRALRTKNVESKESKILPIIGKVAAGTPITALENIEGEFIVPYGLARKQGTFMLRVQGNSMIDAAIVDGDLIIVTPQADASNGEIVVAMVDGEATVKRFFRENTRVRLQPENTAMKPIYTNSVKIIGRVTGVYRHL